MLPYAINVRDVDAKIGGNDFERLRRWYRSGKLNRSQGLVRKRFPTAPTPRQVAKLIREGILENARFAAAVLVKGKKGDDRLQVRCDASFPSLYQIRGRGMTSTPISYATAHLAAIFIKHFPREAPGVMSPEMLPAGTRRAILGDVRGRGFEIQVKAKTLKGVEDEEF
jgi:hypothetical protein